MFFRPSSPNPSSLGLLSSFSTSGHSPVCHAGPDSTLERTEDWNYSRTNSKDTRMYERSITNAREWASPWWFKLQRPVPAEVAVGQWISMLVSVVLCLKDICGSEAFQRILLETSHFSFCASQLRTEFHFVLDNYDLRQILYLVYIPSVCEQYTLKIKWRRYPNGWQDRE